METTSYFANSRGLVIGSNGNFASVNGNQILNYYRNPERKKAPTIYDQFRKVIQGDIYRTKNFGVYRYPRNMVDKRWRRRGLFKSDKTVCTAQVSGAEGRLFTVVSYTGLEAREAFENDFRMFCTTITASSFQVYGINTNVPTVLFYDEHQPAANFLDRLGFWGKLYLESWRSCPSNEIWMDVRRGELCRGPAGPDCELPAGFFHWENLPNSAELLQDDNCLRFLASLKSKVVDLGVVDAITRRGSEGVSAAKVRQPTVFSTSTNASIAVSDGLWKTGAECLSNRKVMENVMIRFTLEDKDDPVFLCMDWVEGYAVWMSQAPGIFHGYGVSLDDDLSQYELIVPHLDLRGPLLNSGIKCQGRREKRIYLFVRPLSTSTPTENCTTSYFHYWSSDPTGQHPLTPEICKDLGLPVELSAEVWPTERYHWDNEPYKWMQQYQVARGFDLKTTDFAQHLGFPTYQVQRDSDRFEDLSLTNRRNREGFWSKWSWAVSEGSDIPAFGM